MSECVSVSKFILTIDLNSSLSLFSGGHATLHLAVSVGPSVSHIFEFQAVFALLLLPNRPRLDCCVFGLVFEYDPVDLFCPFLVQSGPFKGP